MLSITREDAVVFGIAMRDWTADQVEEFVDDSAKLAAMTGRQTPDVMMDAILAAVDLMEGDDEF